MQRIKTTGCQSRSTQYSRMTICGELEQYDVRMVCTRWLVGGGRWDEEGKPHCVVCTNCANIALIKLFAIAARKVSDTATERQLRGANVYTGLQPRRHNLTTNHVVDETHRVVAV